VQPTIGHDVAIGCPAALMPALIDHLSVHRRAHPGLHMLTLGLAHSPEHAHQHLVRRVTRIELAAQLRNPQIDPVGRKPRRDQRELVTEPTPRPLPDHHSAPAAICSLQLGKQPRGLLPSALSG
jgi:hypothetical protein